MAATKAEEVEVAGHTVRLTSADKVYFPERGFTKGDVFCYYLAVGEGIMRALSQRWALPPPAGSSRAASSAWTEAMHSRAGLRSVS